MHGNELRMEYGVICVVILTGVVNIVCLDTTSISMHSTGSLFCPLNISKNEFLRVKWYKSRRDDFFENGNLAVVSWYHTSDPNITKNYDINKDFSLVIYNISIQDKGLYRCHITRNVLPVSKTYDVKLDVYALPWKAPLIQRVNDTFTSCSVDRVYPLLYPHVEFSHEKYEVQNTDGTYNTSVSGSIHDIPSESKVVSCSFPHFNYSQVSSLSLCPTTTPYGNDDEQYPTTHSGSPSSESPNHREKKSITVLWSILAAAAAAVTCFIIGLLLWRKYKKRFFAPVLTESTPAERNGML